MATANVDAGMFDSLVMEIILHGFSQVEHLLTSFRKARNKFPQQEQFIASLEKTFTNEFHEDLVYFEKHLGQAVANGLCEEELEVVDYMMGTITDSIVG